MGFNPPVPQQDSNWEIRVAVLLSLLLQVLLIFLGSIRKRSSSPILRFTVWSCYLLADWVADLGLGLILNNMGNINISGGGGGASSSSGDNSSSPIIFAFWTPFLLLHLGGPDTITAYSLEDNELWLRHLVGLLFELFSATVVIFCSLQSNPLISATMLMLVAGVIKYGERTYSLYSGTVERLRDSMTAAPDPGLDYAKIMGELDARTKAGEDLEIIIAEAERMKEQEMQPEPAAASADVTTTVIEQESMEVHAYEFFLIFRRVFVDVIISFQQRMKSRAFFMERRRRPDLKPKEALELMELELGFMYDMLYTKAPIAYTWKGWVLRCTCTSCLVSALVVFFLLDKPGQQVRRVDVSITYALLLGGLVLDAAALIMILFSDRTMVFLQQQQQQSTATATATGKRLAWLARLSQAIMRWWRRQLRRHSRCWSGVASQMNLIHYCLEKPAAAGPYSNSRNSGSDTAGTSNLKLAGGDGGAWKKKNRRRWLMHMVAKMLRMVEMVDDLVFIQHVKLIFSNKEEDLSYGTLEFIFDGLKRTAHSVGNNKESIQQVCNRRGTGVLQDLRDEINKDLRNDLDKLKVIMESVESRGLDESLLLWHIATDLCLLSRDSSNTDGYNKSPVVEDQNSRILVRIMRAISKILSEYMLYLLIKQPDVLSATAGIGLRPYQDTCAEARRFFAAASSTSNGSGHDGAREALLSVNTSEKPMRVKGDRSKSVLFDGVILAKVLQELDERLMWILVSGLWREMLMFVAVHSRGSTHVRSLNRGGELITIVWLLMQHMGLSDMYEIQQDDPILQLLPPPPPPPPPPLLELHRIY